MTDQPHRLQTWQALELSRAPVLQQALLLTSSFPLLRPATIRFPCRSRLQTELSRSPPQEGSGEALSNPVKDSSPRLLLRVLQPPSSLPQPRERALLLPVQNPACPCGAEGPVKLMELEEPCSSYALPTRLLKSYPVSFWRLPTARSRVSDSATFTCSEKLVSMRDVRSGWSQKSGGCGGLSILLSW